MLIDYGKVHHALLYYRSIGYTHVDVPWIVPEAAVLATLPEGVDCFQVDAVTPGTILAGRMGCLVGSAEQSFLSYRPQGRFVAATPCFRDERGRHEPGVTQREFFKVELWHGSPTVDPAIAAVAMLQDAQRFFQSYSRQVEKIETPDGWDLMLGGLEIGSYGWREVDGYGWAYATGLAEPRFSTALKRAK